MGLVNHQNKKTKLQVGDCLFFHCSSGTVSFMRGVDRLKFCLTNSKNNTQQQFDKKTANYIRSKNDFVSFATFLGKFFLLKGKLLKDNNSTYIWKFTHKGPTPEIQFGPGTKCCLKNDNSNITFQAPEKLLQRTLTTPFIEESLDYDDVLIILTNIIDCSYQILGEKNSRQRIFV